MRAADLRGLELITQDPQNKLPLFGSARLLLVGVPPLTRLGQDLMERLGPVTADAVLFRFGYEAGLGMATSLADMYPWENETEWFLAGAVVRSFSGLALEEIDHLRFERAQGVLSFRGRWRDSIETLIHAGLPDLPAHGGCSLLAGAASGYASACLGREVLVRELACATAGAPECLFEGRAVEEWGLAPEELRQQFSLPQVGDEVGRLRQALEQASRELEAQREELESFRRRSLVPEPQEGILYRSQAMAQALELAAKAAPTATTVLMTGETGTGKELLARFIHRHSGRGREPFLAVNCAALPPNLLESELFGHLRGSFTGAERDKKGLFVEAGAGTLFLDEVGELPLELQAKLLRALQEKEVRPVGGVKGLPVRARIVAASNRGLKEMVAEGTFREDLYYRLAVIPVTLPPLRQRREDILPLARHFLQQLQPANAGFSPAAVRLLEAHAWPGNVRELANLVEYAVVLAGLERIEPQHLPPSLEPAPADSLAGLAAGLPSQEELLRRYTAYVLQQTGGNKSQAARILGIGPNTLWRRLKALAPEADRA
jgi:two-component system, NtrC family, response regulator HydG